MKGRVFLVGSGPGAPGLITVRAQEVIREADVILYDQLPGPEILATLPERSEKIDCGKWGGDHTREQEEIETLMVRRAREGKTVVRLKGGDPFVFGRGGEELETLMAEGIPVEVVPGVTSAFAVPASVGIPVTHRRCASSVTVITGHEDPAKEESALDWEALARLQGTLVILMGVKNLRSIAQELISHGKDPMTPVAVIERGFRPDQRVTSAPLGEIAELCSHARVMPPAIIVIGDVVSMLHKGNPLIFPKK